MDDLRTWKLKKEKIDKNLSNRYIELDPLGYFIIKTDLKKKIILAEHYLNLINKDGLAVDPKTNEPIRCDTNKERIANAKFIGKTAKEIGISITEERNDLISRFDHALYLGRELQKAEESIANNTKYIQD